MASLVGDKTKKWIIAWLDATVNSNDNVATKEKMTDLCATIEVFQTTAPCEQYIRSSGTRPIILVVSGRLSREIVPAVETLNQVSGIFVYCMDASRHTKWAEEHPKVQGIVVNADVLIESIAEHQNSADISSNESDEEFVDSDSSSMSFPAPLADQTNPLGDFQNLSVPTLDKAVAPLNTIVTDLEQMVWIVKQNCEHPPNNLTADEAGAIMLFSLEWYPKETSFICVLNDNLATEDPMKIKPWRPFLKLIFTALAKVPTVKQIVHRGINGDVSHSYAKGGMTNSWEFQYCAPSIQALDSDESFGKAGPRTLLTIDCHSGKDISEYAMDTTKKQIILLPGRQFKIVARLNAGDNLHIVQMQELEPLLKIK